jgi:septum site-determining protein MinC
VPAAAAVISATATAPGRPRQPIRVRGRSFMSFVLAPELPLADWIAELDALIKRSPAFFVGRPVIVDLAAVSLDKVELAALIADLHARGIRVLGIEGADPSSLGLGMPPPLSGGRPVGAIEVPSEALPTGGSSAPQQRKPTPSLVIDGSVRSGQSVVFPEGDLTVVGSVASGAEIVAGGSIHVYGALRGRAIAGSMGNARARIFCSRLEAELLAIDGLYRTADDLEPALVGRRVQVWLEGEAIMTAALD